MVFPTIKIGYRNNITADESVKDSLLYPCHIWSHHQNQFPQLFRLFKEKHPRFTTNQWVIAFLNRQKGFSDKTNPDFIAGDTTRIMFQLFLHLCHSKTISLLSDFSCHIRAVVYLAYCFLCVMKIHITNTTLFCLKGHRFYQMTYVITPENVK